MSAHAGNRRQGSDNWVSMPSGPPVAIRDSLAHSLNPAAKQLSPEEFITVVSNMLKRLGDATTLVGGSIAFVVHSKDDIDRTWRVDLDVPGGDWSNAGGFADVTIHATPSALPAIILYPAAVHGLMHTGELRVVGNAAKLSALGKFVRRSRGMVAQRSAWARGGL